MACWAFFDDAHRMALAVLAIVACIGLTMAFPFHGWLVTGMGIRLSLSRSADSSLSRPG